MGAITRQAEIEAAKRRQAAADAKALADLAPKQSVPKPPAPPSEFRYVLHHRAPCACKCARYAAWVQDLAENGVRLVRGGSMALRSSNADVNAAVIRILGYDVFAAQEATDTAA